ncbi:MAG: hypothetical protein HZC29_03390 [Thaumarchaeota archaeon]|nr:hypothetical protein [Nitrososphaerota archaeon]
MRCPILILPQTIFVLTPQFAIQAGQPFDVSVSFVGVPAQEAEFGVVGLNESDIMMRNFTTFSKPIHGQFSAGVAGPYGQGDVVIVRGEETHKMGNKTLVILKNSAFNVQYVPSDTVQVEPFVIPPGPPHRFMYVGDAGQFGRQTDVTTLVIVVVAVSAALATTWLVIGVKEFKFFSKWNQRYSNYKKLQDELDKDLQD